MDEQAQDIESRTSPDTAGDDRTAPDMSGHLTIKEAQVELFNRGFTRNERSVRRYCNRGDLTCTKVDTVGGQRQYIVNRQSLDTYIEQQLQLLENSTRTEPAHAGHDRTPPAVSGDDRSSEGSELLDLLRDELSHTKEQIRKKDEQIDRKDQQITAMLDRDHETNVLIQNLQGLLQLQAPRQPDMSGDDRHSQSPPHDAYRIPVNLDQ